MDSLIFISPVVNKFLTFFRAIFGELTKPARMSMSLLVLGIVVTSSISVRRCFQCVISKLSSKKLKSFYYLLAHGKIRLSVWSRHIVQLALSCIPEELAAMPILLVIDDTMVEKEGSHFAYRKRMFDHSGYRLSKNKSSKSKDKGAFIDGHCFVSLLMLVPVITLNGTVAYRSIVVAQKMWTGKVSKLVMADQLVRLTLTMLGNRQVILLCDSWYPKGKVAKLVEIINLDLICNVRHDTAMFDRPQRPEKPGPGRPPIYGRKLTLDDFELTSVAETDYKVGCRMVRTNLFGDREVLAFVTQKGEHGSKRLFLCTKPDACKGFLEHIQALPKGDAQHFVEADVAFAPLAVYAMRWVIETSYLELKTFWDFREYRVRCKAGIERLLNLQSLVYSVLSLLPSLGNEFSSLEGRSIQERRWQVEQLLSRQIFLEHLARRLETDENQLPFLKLCKDLMVQDRLAA